jgi:hypothetical protein
MRQWREVFKDTDWTAALLFLVVMGMTILCTVLVVILVGKWFIG